MFNTNLYNLLAQFMRAESVAEAERLRNAALGELTRRFGNEHVAKVKFDDMVYIFTSVEPVKPAEPAHVVLAKCLIDASKLREASYTPPDGYICTYSLAANLATQDHPEWEPVVQMMISNRWNEALISLERGTDLGRSSDKIQSLKL